jgi:hypothetical protein
MSFEHDVFISYPHLSNQDDDSGNNGWVAKFHARLKNDLSEMLGREARIWRDNRLRVGSIFGDDIRDQVIKSRVLLCILSPAYLQSDWCLRELREFHAFAKRSGNLSVDNQSRIITAVKTYIRDEDHPKELGNSIYINFFRQTEDFGDIPMELSQERNEEGYEEYKKRVYRIAWSIKQVIEQLGEADNNIEQTIYLAETTRDRAEDRKKIKDELEARKFTVLPDQPLPHDHVLNYEEAVRENMQRAFMSIHLLGCAYGQIPEGADGRSIVHLQNDLAVAHSKQHKRFKRLIWIQPNLENVEPEQASFLAHLRSSEEAQTSAELHERPLEDLKTRIIQLITKPQSAHVPDNLTRVYVMCDTPDIDSVHTVGRYLFDKGLEVIPPPEEDEDMQVIKYHKESLLLCDAALILYGKTKWNWVQFRLNEVSEKIKGWGREADIPCRAILRTAPATVYKDGINTRIAKVLPPCYNGLSPETLEISLKDFLTDLEHSVNNGI